MTTIATAIVERVQPGANDSAVIHLSGQLRIHALKSHLRDLNTALDKARAQSSPVEARWDLSAMESLDAAMAAHLWRYWGSRLPPQLEASVVHRALFSMLEQANPRITAAQQHSAIVRYLIRLGHGAEIFVDHLKGFVQLIGRLFMVLLFVLRHPREWPLAEISAGVYRYGFGSLMVTALVGFLIGVVLSYLFGNELAVYGANAFLVDLLGIAITRELGPVLAAILVAGRSGSAITAQLGVMRMTQEIDALSVMGLSPSLTLIFPRVVAMMLALPLLVVWTDLAALYGGMLAAKVSLGMSPAYFIDRLPEVLELKHFLLGPIKGFTFGAAIALIACHYGLRIEGNTQSLGEGTTKSVVTAITAVILIDAVFAIVTQSMGV